MRTGFAALLLGVALAPAATAATAPAGSAPVVVETRVSYVAHVFHWVDYLAETTPSKTRESFYRRWNRRFGSLDERDRAVLAQFRQVRAGGALAEPPLASAGDGCVPAVDPVDTPRQVLSAASMRANDLDQFASLMREFLGPTEAEAVAVALRHFEPRIRQLWPETAFLAPFQKSFDAFIAAPATQQLITDMADYLEAKPRPGATVHISLVAALGEDTGTHAEASGEYLLLEVRPADTPEQQVQVLFHELAHYFMQRMPAETRAGLAARMFRGGFRGALAWNLAREALPTALGQGLAQAKLAPRQFGSMQKWYHRPAEDALAHALYPGVSRAFAAGGTVSPTLPELLQQGLTPEAVSAAPPFLAAVEAGFLAPARLQPALLALVRVLAGPRYWRVPLDGPQAQAFADRFSCLPLVLLVQVSDLERAPVPDAERARLRQAWTQLAHGSAGIIAAGERASGAPLLWLLVATPEDATAVIPRALDLATWPQRPVAVPRGRRSSGPR